MVHFHQTNERMNVSLLSFHAIADGVVSTTTTTTTTQAMLIKADELATDIV